MNESSGRESPCLLTHASSTVGFSQLQQQQQRSASASSTGGASVSRLLRKGLLADLGGAQEREAAALRRFREVGPSKFVASWGTVCGLDCTILNGLLVSIQVFLRH